MTAIKFICYGSSVDNLKSTFEFNIIGTPKKTFFVEGEQVYLVLKRDKEWNVCGRANVKEETDLNPFEIPKGLYTYLVTNVEACIPFQINEKCRDLLGPHWGLNFQTPRAIENEEFSNFIENNFHPLKVAETLNILH